jgi:hypothetical protein
LVAKSTRNSNAKLDRHLAHRAAQVLAAIDFTHIHATSWTPVFEEFTGLSKRKQIFTHLSFVATILLAKSVDASLDVMVIKPTHATQVGNYFSARGLCKSVFIPFAVINGIDLGTRGNDPLNNQPYGRMVEFGDGVPIATRGQELFQLVENIVLEVHAISDEQEAKVALGTLLRALKTHGTRKARASTTLSELKRDVNSLSRRYSEYGRVAQAVVAGLIEAAFGDVKTKLVNDPSRRSPGDIQFSLPGGREEECKCLIEVRDKIVSETDARIFYERCMAVGVDRAIIFVSTKNVDKQEFFTLESDRFFGCMIVGTDALIDQLALWSCSNLGSAADLITSHLVKIGVSESCLNAWQNAPLIETPTALNNESDEAPDAALTTFLDLIADDIQKHPESLREIPATLIERTNALTIGTVVAIDDPILGGVDI